MVLAMPSTALPNRLIVNETEPRQWQITWMRRSPMRSRIVAIAAG
jgi:hypothetical protein